MRSAFLPVVPVVRLLAVGVSVLATLAGCAHDSEERQLDEMLKTIDEVQQDRDQAEKDMMASSIADTHGASGTPERQPAPALAPPQSIPLGDGPGDGMGDGLDGPDTEDPSPRPTIRIFGSPRVGRNGWREDQVEQSGAGADDGSGQPRSSALDPEAKPAYDAALALVSARQYDRALDAFAAFLVKYPDHPYADNAMYWRGECYFAKGDYLHASEQFEGTVTRFPAGNKAPDALLKLGMSHQKLGNPAKAKECFDRLAHAYPQSEAARHIPPVFTSATTPRGTGSEDHR
jgi:tol-pal system protein YbgF